VVQAAVAEEAPDLLMQYVCVPCRLIMQPLAEVPALVAVSQQVRQRALVSVAWRQVWVQVSVAQDDWRALMVRRLDHRAAEACPL
jgi:hypothetical protein